MNKKILTLVLVLALCVTAFVACAKDADDGTTSPSAPSAIAPSVSQSVVIGGEGQDVNEAIKDLDLADSYSFAYLVKTMTNPFFVDIENGIKEVLRESDELTTFECNNEAGIQITKSEDIATAGYDVCLITPIDFEGVAGPLRTLRDAGVITVLVDSLAKDMSLADASSVSDNFQAGVLAGEACAKDLEEKYGEVKGKIAIFENTTSPPVRDRVAGFESVINTTNYPNIEIAIRENGKGQIDTGMDAMDNFLQAVPDLDAVFSMNDPSAQGCANAIEAAGKTGEIFVYGVDGSDASKEFIKAGKQNGSSAQFPITMGQEAVILSYKLLAGETLDNPHIKIPCEWIDASNVEQYITQK